MTGPALDARRFGIACLMGAALGIYYGFLRPLRPKHTALSDLLFIPAAGYSWLYLGFAVCRGDIRLSYCMGLLVGATAWEMTVGRWLRPVLYGFWGALSKIFHKIFRIFEKFFKKIKKFAIFLFSKQKKWFTIIWRNCRYRRQRIGGVTIGKEEEHTQPDSTGVPPQSLAAQMRSACDHYFVHGRTDSPAVGHQPVSGEDRYDPAAGSAAGTGKQKAGRKHSASGHRRRRQAHCKRRTGSGRSGYSIL